MKRFLKLMVSLSVYLADRVSSAGRHLINRPSGGACAVLYYHEVVAKDRERFAAQLDVICRVAQPVPAWGAQLIAKDMPRVAITVDDAFVSFFRNGFPEIVRRNIPILVFVPTQWLGRRVDWTMEEVMASPDERICTLAELKEFARHPLVHLGSHTARHRKLSSLDEAEALKELAESKAFLEREFGAPIETVSFPYGGYTAREVKLAAGLGYKRSFSTSPHIVSDNTGSGLVGRFRIDPSDWMLEVKLKAAGAYRWQSRLQLVRSWLRCLPPESNRQLTPACTP